MSSHTVYARGPVCNEIPICVCVLQASRLEDDIRRLCVSSAAFADAYWCSIVATSGISVCTAYPMRMVSAIACLNDDFYSFHSYHFDMIITGWKCVCALCNVHAGMLAYWSCDCSLLWNGATGLQARSWIIRAEMLSWHIADWLDVPLETVIAGIQSCWSHCILFTILSKIKRNRLEE